MDANTSLLLKQLDQLQREYGDLQLSSYEAQQHLHNQINFLTEELNSSRTQNQTLKLQLSETNIFKKQHLELESENVAIKGELQEMKEKFAEMEECRRNEKVLVEKLRENERIMAEKMKEERVKNEVKYKKLQFRYGAVLASATGKGVELRDRVSNMEKKLDVLKMESTSKVPQEEKPSTVPSFPQSPFVVDLDSTDDDVEAPSSATLKRKLQITGASKEEEKDDGSLEKCTKHTE